MKPKKILSNTVGVVVGGVGITEANKIDGPMGKALGTTMGAGMVSDMTKKKKWGF